jgi:hypothetical protein
MPIQDDFKVVREVLEVYGGPHSLAALGRIEAAWPAQTAVGKCSGCGRRGTLGQQCRCVTAGGNGRIEADRPAATETLTDEEWAVAEKAMRGKSYMAETPARGTPAPLCSACGNEAYRRLCIECGSAANPGEVV